MGTLVGCSGSQSVLDAAGPQAARITGLWWLYLGISVGVYGAVLVAMTAAVARRRVTGPSDRVAVDGDPAHERRAGMVVSGAVGVTTVLLLVMLGGEAVVGRSLRDAERAPDPVNIQVTGHRWWWDIEYQDGEPAGVLRTANQIHVPTGRPVRLTLQSADVIHSFWVPNLHGKRDLVPGHPTTLTFTAERPGTYWGQCAEYCGMQHAHMRFVLTAEDPESFAAWRTAQLASAPEPVTDSQRHGRDVFLSQTCAMCHTVSGTSARSRAGPDLSHVGSRPMLASGSIPNTRGQLAGWIVDPQHVKPGVIMPTQSIAPSDLHDLLDFLESLR
jgi:cytochrome c oxidase subunit 2